MIFQLIFSLNCNRNTPKSRINCYYWQFSILHARKMDFQLQYLNLVMNYLHVCKKNLFCMWSVLHFNKHVYMQWLVVRSDSQFKTEQNCFFLMTCDFWLWSLAPQQHHHHQPSVGLLTSNGYFNQAISSPHGPYSIVGCFAPQ